MSELPSPVLTQSDLPVIIQRYLQGESIQDLAKEARTHQRTIYRWMLGGAGDKDYADLVTECLVSRVADSDEMLMNAHDSCHIARARELARFTRMDLERRRPQLYGPKQETKTDVSITVVIQRLTEEPKTIESTDHETED